MEENVKALKKIAEANSNAVDTMELLPFRKVCEVKYKNMNRPFPFAHIPEPTEEKMKELNAILR